MTGVLDRLQDFAGWVGAGRIELPEVFAIPTNQCIPLGSAGVDILNGQHYFSVRIHELFLDYARFGWATFVPMVVTTVSFVYGGKRISVPSIVGPGLLETKGQQLPKGILLQDTTIAGPYPFRGGPVAISLVFYRLQHLNYAKQLLKVVESISSAIGPAADLGLLAKVGGTLIGGVDDLLGMGQTVPIAGHRIELSPLKPGGFRTCFSALTDVANKVPIDRLKVDCGRLKVLNSDGSFQKYQDANYILYSIEASERRDDETSLPFYPAYERALSDAARGGKERWKSAKATFSEVWQQLILSPDLTKPQAKELFQQWKDQLLDTYKTGDNAKLMSLEADLPEDKRVDIAAELLDEE
jgi:hypothetical protein